MAWRSNFLQKSFVRDCSSLLKNDLRFTRRWQSLQVAVACCAFCALFMCLSKMLKLCIAEVSSFRFWWVLSALCCWGSVLILLRFTRLAHSWCCLSDCWLMLSAVSCWGGILFLEQQLGVWSLDAVSPLLLKQRPGVSSDSLIVGCCQNSLRQHFNAECAEMRLVRWWACSGSNRLCFGLSGFFFYFWRGPFVVLDPSEVCFLRWVRGWWCQIVVWCCQPFVALVASCFCHWHWYHSLFVTIVWFLGSLMAQGAVLWRCRKNRKPRLDFSFRCLISSEAHLWRISTLSTSGSFAFSGSISLWFLK